MKNRLLSFVLSATAAVACSSSSGSETALGGEPNADPPATEGPAPGADPGGSASSSSSSSSGGPAASPPAIAAASIRNIGRRGDTLRIQVSGTDPSKQTSAAHVRFTDDTGAPVDGFDTDWDGVADAPAQSFHFDTTTLGAASIDGTLTIARAFGVMSKIKKAFIALENDAGVRSTEVEATLTHQLLKAANEPCDEQHIESRCEAGLSCTGKPATCHPGAAPVLSKVGYFGGASPKMVFRGEEADEDISSITVEFLDNASNAKSVVLSGEGADGISATSIDIDARGGAFGTTFFLEALPASSFVSQVPKIAATAVDLVGRSSTRLVTPLSTLPVRSTGQACDPDGFDACTKNTVCFPGLRAEKNTCQAASTKRAAKCKALPGLDPSAGPTRAFGTVSGVSLWDAPQGCVPNDATGRPEAAIPLHLATAAPSLTITTALPETSFDTAVYLIPACAASSADALGCNDDTKGFSSTLTLKDVPAGDYTIVVESVQMAGGRFGVAVALE